MMHVRTGLARSWGAVALVVVVTTVVVVAIVVTRGIDDGQETASAGYCLVLDKPFDEIEVVRSAIGGKPVAYGLDLAALRAGSTVMFSDDIADGAPAGLERDAARVLRAIRVALAERSTSPLDTPPVQASARALAGRGPRPCNGVLG